MPYTPPLIADDETPPPAAPIVERPHVRPRGRCHTCWRHWDAHQIINAKVPPAARHPWDDGKTQP